MRLVVPTDFHCQYFFMKKTFRVLLIVIVVLGVTFFAFRFYTKSHSPAAVAVYQQNGLDVEVHYCQPARKGRVIFGELIPYGSVWRTGANEATLIAFKQDVMLAGKRVPAGTYTLWTIPTAQDWILIINNETGQWGTNYDEKQDRLRVQVPSQSQSETTESFTIDFLPLPNGTTMRLRWDQTEVLVPITKL